MSHPFRLILACAAFNLVVAVGQASAADAPRPVISMTTTATDPARYGWIMDDGRAALAANIAAQKSGSQVAFVFAAAPGGNFWAGRPAIKATDFVSIEDLARQALEVCEYFAHTPCYLISINGYDVRDAAGGLQIQPYFLGSQPTEFDPQRVPFLSAGNWNWLQGYQAQTKAKALIITYGGGAWWQSGDDVAKAVAAAYADCQTANATNACALYAVNNRVVFTASSPH